MQRIPLRAIPRAADPTNLFDIRARARALCYRSGESTGQVLIEFADERPADNQAGCGRAEEMLYAPLRDDGAGREQVSASRRKHKQANKQTTATGSARRAARCVGPPVGMR